MRMVKIWNYFEKLIYNIMKNLSVKILKKDYADNQHAAFMQFVKFGIVGVSNTVISYVLYAATLLILQKADLFPKTDYLWAQIVAFILSVLWSFYWNNKMVFVTSEESERVWWKALIKTYISYSFTGLLLNSILLILWVKICGMSEFVAPILNLLISVPLNFLINKFWAFKATNKKCECK